MIIDSHCHIDFNDFDKDRDEVLQRAEKLGIKKIIVPGVQQKTWQRITLYSQTYPQLYPCYGLHPYFINEHKKEDINLLKIALEKNSPVAVGECGLDFFLKNLDKEKQQFYFEQQLDLAIEFNLPAVIHARKSTEAVIKAIKIRPGLRGMIHSYSGSYEQAVQLIDLGFYLSFGGPITYEKSTRLRKLVERLPLSSLLVETDAPDQPVANADSNRTELNNMGTIRNEPAFILDVIQSMALLHDIEPDEIASITTDNANTLFQLV